MRKYRTSRDVISTKGEDNFPDSVTVPDLAPSMRELLVRHAQGITDNVSMNLSFSGDLPDLRGTEPHDLANMLLEQQRAVKALAEYQDNLAIQMRQAEYAEKRKNDLELLAELKKRELQDG